MDEQNPTPNRQLVVMRWISFAVVNVLFVIAVAKNIFSDTSTDKILAGVFLIVTGFVWGANLWKLIVAKLP